MMLVGGSASGRPTEHKCTEGMKGCYICICFEFNYSGMRFLFRKPVLHARTFEEYSYLP